MGRVLQFAIILDYPSFFVVVFEQLKLLSLFGCRSITGEQLHIIFFAHKRYVATLLLNSASSNNAYGNDDERFNETFKSKVCLLLQLDCSFNRHKPRVRVDHFLGTFVMLKHLQKGIFDPAPSWTAFGHGVNRVKVPRVSVMKQRYTFCQNMKCLCPTTPRYICFRLLEIISSLMCAFCRTFVCFLVSSFSTCSR